MASRDVDTMSQMSGFSGMSGSAYTTGGSGSMASGFSVPDGPFPWGTQLEWMRAPPGLPPPPPPGLVPPGQVAAAGKSVLWNATDQDGQPPLPTAAAPSAPIGTPGSPMVLWCEAKPTMQMEVMEAIASYFGDQQPQFVHFQTPPRFTRWLFEQPRGEVSPWALLVVGWREAKPSAMAIGAARTGDTSSLRPDAKRPPLPPITGDPKGQVGVAVESMIIMLEKPEHEERVITWAKEGGKGIADLDVHVASSVPSLRTVVETLKSAKAPASDKKTVISL